MKDKHRCAETQRADAQEFAAGIPGTAVEDGKHGASFGWSRHMPRNASQPAA